MTVDVKVKVIDDEDMFLVTSGAIVTVVVNLTRSTFAEHFEKDADASGDSGYAGRDLGEVTCFPYSIFQYSFVIIVQNILESDYFA